MKNTQNKVYAVEVVDLLASKAYNVIVSTTVQFADKEQATSFSWWAKTNHFSVKFHMDSLKILKPEEQKMSDMLMKFWNDDKEGQI